MDLGFYVFIEFVFEELFFVLMIIVILYLRFLYGFY